MAAVPAGPFVIGHSSEGFAYDNERPQHELELRAFFINRAPVTNSRYLAFVEDGGYARRELWDPDGWSWRREERVEAPRLWRARAATAGASAPSTAFSHSIRDARWCTCRGTRRTPTRAGPACAFPPSPNGSGRRYGTRSTGAPGAGRG